LLILPGGGDLSGKVKLKVEPLPTSLFTQIFSPYNSTNFLANGERLQVQRRVQFTHVAANLPNVDFIPDSSSQNQEPSPAVFSLMKIRVALWFQENKEFP